MNRTVIIRALAVLALAQVGLAIYTHLDSAPLATSSSHGVLLSFDKDKVDSLSINGMAADEKVVLSKRDGKWQLASGFPADQDKVGSLLDKLVNLKHGLPVTTSAAALKRFKVAEDEFERSVILQQGNTTLGSLYLGTGNGARQNNVRTASDQAVYSIALGSYDLPAKADEWEDKTVLKLDKQTVTSITLGDLRLTPAETADKQAPDAIRIWKMESVPAGKLINQQAINENLNALLSLSYRMALGKDSKPEYGLDKPVLTVKVAHQSGEREYRFGQLKDKDDYVLKASDRAEYFQIPGYEGKPLVEGMLAGKWLMDEVKAEAPAAPAVTTETPATPAAAPTQ